MNIQIGLTTWNRHPHLLPTIKTPTLTDYSHIFPVVELDTFFYALKDANVVANWQQQVPANFKFIVKVPSELTWQQELAPTTTFSDLFMAFRQTIAPIIASQQLAGVLMQFPPAFDLTEQHLNYLTLARKNLPKLPILLEFRHRSWSEPQFIGQITQRLQKLQLTWGIIDEPNIGLESVPRLPLITTPPISFWRFHGRNAENWAKKGAGSKEGRTLYRYSTTELQQLAAEVQAVASQVTTNYVIFNNNANGDAADNALEFSQILGLNYQRPGGEQLDLF
ncbi:MAG: DUF72 domain-containing protein [Lactobacillaceae bacterium]|jgi:uncharacterized protein YecE (DUF72 family)|nr:DUF72 domain-containing protein [Lactobacillaceae bacterium]